MAEVSSDIDPSQRSDILKVIDQGKVIRSAISKFDLCFGFVFVVSATLFV